MNKLSILLRNFLGILVFSIFGGCGGGGGGGDNSVSGSATNPNLDGLKGVIYFDRPNNMYSKFKFDDQKSSPILSLESSEVSASPDASKFAIISPSSSLISVYSNGSGKIEAQIKTSGEYFGPARLSFDNKLLAYYWKDGAEVALIIRDLSDNTLIRKLVEVGGDEVFDLFGWDFLPNNNVVFSMKDSIYNLTDLESGIPILIQSFTGYDVGNVTLSRDGKQVAFTLAFPDATRQAGDIYIMNIDGSNVRQLTSASKIVRISWSPDSKFVAAIDQNRAGDVGMPTSDNCPDIYIIPTAGENIASIRSQDPYPAFRLQHNVGGRLEDICVNSSIDWR